MEEGHVVRWDQNITFWYKLHLPGDPGGFEVLSYDTLNNVFKIYL